MPHVLMAFIGLIILIAILQYFFAGGPGPVAPGAPAPGYTFSPFHLIYLLILIAFVFWLIGGRSAWF